MTVNTFSLTVIGSLPKLCSKILKCTQFKMFSLHLSDLLSDFLWDFLFLMFLSSFCLILLSCKRFVRKSHVYGTY